MNLGIFTGNLGRDCEIRVTQTGKTCCTFSIAVKCGYGDNAKTMWIRCTDWTKRAEGGLPAYLVKGQQVCVSGELSINEYESQGEKRTSLEMNVRDIDLVGSKSAPQQQQGIVPEKAQESGGGVSDFEDAIPF